MNKPTAEILESQDMDLENVIVPRIESIFTQLSRQQIELVKSGEPDDFTKDLFAKLMLDLVESLTKALAEGLNDKCVPVQQHVLLSYLSKALSVSFSETCHVKQAYTEILDDLISTEVKGSLECLSSEDCKTTPCIPTDSTDHIGRKSKTLAEKVKSICPRCILKRRPSCTEAPVSSQSAVAAQDTKSHELLEIAETRSDELMESELYNEAKRITTDIITAVIGRLSEEDYEQSSPAFTCTTCLKKACRNVIIFTKQLAKDLVHQIVVEIKERFRPDSEPEDAESIRTLKDSVDTLIVAVTDDSDENDDISVLQNYKNIFSSKAQKFTKGLSDLIYKHIKSRRGADVTPEPLPESSSCTSESVGPSDATMYARIQGQVQNCLELIGQFIRRQTKRHDDVRQVFHGSGTETLAQEQPLDSNKGSLSSEDCKTTPCIPTDSTDHIGRKSKTLAEKVKSICPRCILKRRPSFTEAPVSSQSAVAAQDTTSHELLEIAETRSDELMESELYNEAKRITTDIITAVIGRLSEEDYEQSSPAFTCTTCLKKACRNVIIFTKQLAKDLVHQIVVEIKERFRPDSEPEDAESIRTLKDSVDTLIVAVTDDSDENDDISVLQNYKNIFSSKAQKFTKGLSDLIYKHIKSRRGADVTPEPLPESSSCTSESVGPSDATMYARIQGQVQNCLELIGQFIRRQTKRHDDVRQVFHGSGTETLAQEQPLDSNKGSLSSEDCKTTPCIPTDSTDHIGRKSKTLAEKVKSICPRFSSKSCQAESHDDRRAFHESGTETLAQEQPLDISVVEDRTPVESEDPELQTKKKELFLRLLLERLMSKTYKKAKIDIRLGRLEAIIEKLYDETWAELKDIDFDTSRKCEKLPKVIFKELYKNSNNSHMRLLVSMHEETKKVAKCIALSIRSHLTKPKRCSPISNFFSRLRGQIFRQKNRVGVV
uniref:uncharacterized protein LOC109956823 isoform X2 n=1 Tax=Monopterus albus TaxID=43700 RepID=UPI0009B37D2A|nr:uncharacterized protein LOC109956823 isoform X2 [Monopterus albus]